MGTDRRNRKLLRGDDNDDHDQQRWCYSSLLLAFTMLVFWCFFSGFDSGIMWCGWKKLFPILCCVVFSLHSSCYKKWTVEQDDHDRTKILMSVTIMYVLHVYLTFATQFSPFYFYLLLPRVGWKQTTWDDIIANLCFFVDKANEQGTLMFCGYVVWWWWSLVNYVKSYNRFRHLWLSYTRHRILSGLRRRRQLQQLGLERWQGKIDKE